MSLLARVRNISNLLVITTLESKMFIRLATDELFFGFTAKYDNMYSVGAKLYC